MVISFGIARFHFFDLLADPDDFLGERVLVLDGLLDELGEDGVGLHQLAGLQVEVN